MVCNYLYFILEIIYFYVRKYFSVYNFESHKTKPMNHHAVSYRRPNLFQPAVQKLHNLSSAEISIHKLFHFKNGILNKE